MALECSEPRTERKQLCQFDRTGHDTDYPVRQKPLTVLFALREEKNLSWPTIYMQAFFIYSKCLHSHRLFQNFRALIV